MPIRPIAPHLMSSPPTNPFPGRAALERRLGRGIQHQLGSNEGLDMPHSALSQHLGDRVAQLARQYGDPEAYSLRMALAQRLGVPLATLVVDAGADALMALSLRTLCQPNDIAVASAGTYPTFGYFARSAGCKLIETPYRQTDSTLAPDLDALYAQAHQHQARVVYLANPDNPSGSVQDDVALARFIHDLPACTTLILDEAYFDFRQSLPDSFPQEGVIRLRTFSKAHGLAGLRIGYAIATEPLISTMNSARIHYSVSSLALEAASLMLAHDDEVQQHIHQVISQRNILASQLHQAGARVYASETNFLAVGLPASAQAAELHSVLLSQGTVVHRPPHEHLNHILRITTTHAALDPTALAPLWDYLAGAQ